MLICGLFTAIYILVPPPTLTMLLTGVDARPGEGYLTRTDTIMLLSLDPARRQVSLLSIPRDLSIATAGYGLQRINVVNALGEQEAAGRGNTLLIDSIETNFMVDVDRFVRLDFNGFVGLIDAVGGVTINVENTITDSNFPSADGGSMVVEFQQGEQTMDGATALIFARTRYSDDDYRRAARQQQVVAAVAGKLINPFHWGALVALFNGSINTNINIVDLLLYAPVVVFNTGRFETLIIDRELISGTAEGIAIPNYAALSEWLDAYAR